MGLPRWAAIHAGVALALVGACAGTTTTRSSQGIEARSAQRELAVPDVRQATPYTCGASALQAVLAYFGIEEREDALGAELGATPTDGVTPAAIVRAATARGLSARFATDTRVEDLEAALGRREPVILAIQAWGKGRAGGGYADDWQDGHFVVLVGLDGAEVVVEDPSLLGSRGVMTRAELLERWHDEDLGVRTRRGAIFVSGRRPSPPVGRAHVD